MPRQLPWANKSAGGRAQLKQPPKPKAGTRALSDSDDDFFDGTVLAGSSKGKGKAIRDVEDSGDDLPDLPAEPSTPRTKGRTKDALRNKRAQSSSPPPIQDHVQPEVEYMRTGASRFDLRDDEWMMVEDEFLETAKLFTRHLHIAEYQKLKERIEAKKAEQVQAVRPVIIDGKMSAEGMMKKKAEVQEKRQIKAIQDVFASQIDDDEEDAVIHRSKATTQATASSLKRPTNPPTTQDSDSDDLDVSRAITKRPAVSKPNPASASSSRISTGRNSALPANTFAKPALPAARSRLTARKSRATPFDMLDDYKPRSTPAAANGRETPSIAASRSAMSATDARASTTPVRSSLSPKPTATGTSVRRKALDYEDEWVSKDKTTAERIPKRKAEREKERGSKKKSATLDDIPTFLF